MKIVHLNPKKKFYSDLIYFLQNLLLLILEAKGQSSSDNIVKCGSLSSKLICILILPGRTIDASLSLNH